MPSSLDELKTRIDELKADLAFVSLAAQLRPRIGDVLDWQGSKDVLELAKSFMSEKSSRPEGFYGPLLVRLMAAFERHVRGVVVYVIDERSSKVTKYDDLADVLGKRNIALTGRVLAAIYEPRDHLNMDFKTLIDNLATCKTGATTFRLNSDAFCAVVTGTSPTVIEKALKHVEIEDFWDAVGANASLAKALNTKGPRATGSRAQEVLLELTKLRNHLAHAGDEDVVISESRLTDAIQFVLCFCDALHAAIRKQLAAK